MDLGQKYDNSGVGYTQQSPIPISISTCNNWVHTRPLLQLFGRLKLGSSEESWPTRLSASSLRSSTALFGSLTPIARSKGWWIDPL